MLEGQVRGIASNGAVSTTPQIMYLVMLQDAISMWYERVDSESNQVDELSRIDLLAQDLCTKVGTLNEYSRRAEASQWFHFH